MLYIKISNIFQYNDTAHNYQFLIYINLWEKKMIPYKYISCTVSFLLKDFIISYLIYKVYIYYIIIKIINFNYNIYIISFL